MSESPLLFSELERILAPGESLQFLVERTTDPILQVSVIPSLNKEADHMPEEAEKYRALLAQPLFIKESSEKLDSEFFSILESYRQAHNQIRSAFDDLINTMNESAKEITRKTQKSRKKIDSGGEVSEDTRSSPDSL